MVAAAGSAGATGAAEVTAGAGVPLFDPMCGSGTILVEAAQMVQGIPPGARRKFAFEQFRDHDRQAWADIVARYARQPPAPYDRDTALASTLAIRAALQVDPAEAIG